MNRTREWVSTGEMSKSLGIHPKTLLKLRADDHSPFIEGNDYRWAGCTSKGKLQWHQVHAENSFTSSKRMNLAAIETYSRNSPHSQRRTNGQA